MKVVIDRKLKRYSVDKFQQDVNDKVAADAISMRGNAAKEKKKNNAREYYAASKIQAIVKGFLDRIVCRKLRKHARAVSLISRVFKGKIGRMRWKREYYRSISVVKSDRALEELLARSTELRAETIRNKKGKSFVWREYFDSLTESFWYYNADTKQNTWECPLIFQKSLICPWLGFPTFGDMPHQKPCRSVFGTLEEYRNHLRTAHTWYCMACFQRNKGANFPHCLLCGNKLSGEGIDGEKALFENINKIKFKLGTFLFHDVSTTEVENYKIKDRIVGLAVDRKNAKEETMRLLQLAEDAATAARMGLSTAGHARQIMKQVEQLNASYKQAATTTYDSVSKAQKFVVTSLSDPLFADSPPETNGGTGGLKLPRIAGADSSSVHSKTVASNQPATSRTSSSGIKGVIGSADMQSGSVNKMIAGMSTAFSVDGNANQADVLPKESTVTRAAIIQEYKRAGGIEAEKALFRDPITKGIFSEEEFNFLTSLKDGDAIPGDGKLDLFVDREDSDDDDTSQRDVADADGGSIGNSIDSEDNVDAEEEKESNDDINDGTGAQSSLVSAVKLTRKTSIALHANDNASATNMMNSMQKAVAAVDSTTTIKFRRLEVCPLFLKGTCKRYISCPLAHPGSKDSADIRRRAYTNKTTGKKALKSYVYVCPQYMGVEGSCSKGKFCRQYHVYVRPSTQQLIMTLYPTAEGIRLKEFKDGSKLSGNVKRGKYNGYAVMTWANGATYMGDWVDDLRDGFGIYRSASGLEYVGCYSKGLRHGWGVLTNPNGESYTGEWNNGQMSGLGILNTRYGDVYEGNFKDNLYHGLGSFKKANGDYYIGHCEKGMAGGGLGILVLRSGEMYKGNFLYNARHGRGAAAYPNGSRYAGEWYYGVHHGHGVYLSPLGDKYIGSWAGGKKHGMGRYCFRNGDFYDGEFVKDKAKGMGFYYHTNGNTYHGMWDNDMRNGRGTYNFANGSKYTGHWLNNDIHIKGKFDFASGATFRGHFDTNTKHGKGIFTWASGNVYSGEFVHDKLCGFGEMKYMMGHRYVGYWKDNKKNGKGTMFYSGGPIYVGEWVDDLRHGQGKITFMSGYPIEESYEGNWIKDAWHGFGKYIYRKDEGTVYEGEWDQGHRHGKGIITYKDGSYYRGDFVNEQMWGKGVYVGSDGTQYDGEWRANMRQGLGVYIGTDGCIYKGEFVGNLKHGTGTLYKPDGSKYAGQWFANIIVGEGIETIVVGKKELRDGLPKEISMKVFGY